MNDDDSAVSDETPAYECDCYEPMVIMNTCTHTHTRIGHSDLTMQKGFMCKKRLCVCL